MNKKKIWRTIVPALALSLALSACSSNGGDNAGNNSNNSNNGNNGGNDGENVVTASQLPILSASPYQLAGREEGAAEFQAAHADYESPYQNDTCVNITPDFVPADSGLSVFKYDASHETFVYYEGTAYPIGGDSSGDGVTSMAMADFTGDGAYELYFAYSNGANSRVGYFDPAQKTVTEISGAVFNGQPIVLSDSDSALAVCGAEVSDYESLTAMTLTPGDELASVYSADGKIQLEMKAAAE